MENRIAACIGDASRLILGGNAGSLVAAAALVPSLAKICRLRCSEFPSTPALSRGRPFGAVPVNRPEQPEPDHHGARESAGEKMLRELKSQGVKPAMPWDVGMSQPEAAHRLGSFLGVSSANPLLPGEVIVMSKDQMTALLHATASGADAELQRALFVHADSVSDRYFGKDVCFRGIIEFSNVCQLDCGYCGIRKHQKVWRYTMPVDEVVETAKWAYGNGIHTVMLQSGEVNTPKRYSYLVDMVRRIREETIAMDLENLGGMRPENTDSLGIVVALSAGELPTEVMKDLWEVGARRYLIRIETSNPDLFAKLHPPKQTWESRVASIQRLKEMGFQLGTGVMVGLPGQTLGDLAGDIEFFRKMDADMIGMGPFITEEGTPATEMWKREVASRPGFDKKLHMDEMVLTTMRMNALARINLGNVNIAATTALQAIDPMGREIALSRGANVLMPILTPTKYRENYQLYEGKPCITDTAEECRRCLNARVSMVGKTLLPNSRSDPPHFNSPASRPSDLPGTRHFSAAPRGAPRGFHSSADVRSAVPEPKAEPERKAAGPVKGSDVPRVNIGVFGSMNAGKSTLMNLITRQETSIVDSTPGTTADTKLALMELHSVGPTKLFDTAGIDEQGVLGDKKRAKTLSALKECDVATLVIDPVRCVGDLAASLSWERRVIEEAARHGVAPFVVFNVRRGSLAERDALDACRKAHQFLSTSLPAPATAGINNRVDPDGAAPSVPYLMLDLHDAASVSRDAVVASLERIGQTIRPFIPRSLPREYLTDAAHVFLNIPMDDETPSMRLLRPQALLQEEAIRHWASTSAYRMDLAAARSGDRERVEREKGRFMRALEPLLRHEGPGVLVTDSQAMDVVHPWTVGADGKPLCDITTFSISMIHRQSGGQLPLFAEGLRAYKALRGKGSEARVLIAEACNHNRITDTCNDIGMVQLPDQLRAHIGDGVQIDHAFGREFPDLANGLGNYDLVLHCGACMIDHQKVRARLSDLRDAGVPVTNYGLLLAWGHHGDDALARVLAPWGVSL